MWLLMAPVIATASIIIGECASAPYVEAAIAKRPAIYLMWIDSIATSLCNIWCIGLPLHALIQSFIIQHYTPSPWFIALPVLVLTQHFLFHAAHFAMHKWLYSIHKYHHQFADTVTPASGIAVTAYEFLLAYSLPVIIGLMLGRPSPCVLAWFLSLEYAATIFVHSAFLESNQYKYVVTPAYHVAHHSKCPTKNLAAPLITWPDLLFKTRRES